MINILESRIKKILERNEHGQSMVEFALILPLFVLFIVGIFELGRAFFSYIAITNAAREGARVVTFWPGKTTYANVDTAVRAEVGASPMVNKDPAYLTMLVQCGNDFHTVSNTTGLQACPSFQPIRVTLTYKFELILKIFFPTPLTLRRSAEMMMP
jgi:Flp pilus assembly protein TadG